MTILNNAVKRVMVEIEMVDSERHVYVVGGRIEGASQSSGRSDPEFMGIKTSLTDVGFSVTGPELTLDYKLVRNKEEVIEEKYTRDDLQEAHNAGPHGDGFNYFMRTRHNDPAMGEYLVVYQVGEETLTHTIPAKDDNEAAGMALRKFIDMALTPTSYHIECI